MQTMRVVRKVLCTGLLTGGRQNPGLSSLSSRMI